MDVEESNPDASEENVEEHADSELKRSADKIYQTLFEDYDWKIENSGLVGFKNLGETCYMNSTLQCLVHCPPLLGLFCGKEFAPDKAGKAPLLHDFSTLMRTVWHGKRRVVAPQDIFRDVMKLNPTFQSMQQQDAQELLITVLGNLDDMSQRVLPLPPTKEDLELIAKIEEQERKESEEQTEREQSMESLFEIGDAVVISGLKNGNYNGTRGKVVTGINEKGRYGVKLHKIGKSLSFKAHNLSKDGGKQDDDSEMQGEEDPPPKKKKLSPPPKRKAFRSPITDIFSGAYQNEMTCSECGHVSKVLNSFQDLSLPIPTSDMLKRTVEQRGATPPAKPGFFSSIFQAVGLTNSQTNLDMCLHAFCTSEDLQDSERYHCEKCKRKVDAEKVMSIALLPEILVLHIKRFNYHASFWGGSKNSTLVDFPAELNMQSYLHKDFVDHEQNINSDYELYGLVRHMGSLSGGHYIAYCRRPDDPESWFCFDDSSVTSAPLQKVLQKEAYLLFYCRKNPDPDAIRQQVWNVLEKNLNDCNYKDSDQDVYASSYFFQKLKHYCHIGNLDNHRLMCPHGKILPNDDRRFTENSVRIPLKSWKALEHKFKAPKKGGIPLIKCTDTTDSTKLDCIQCQSQLDYQAVSRFMGEKYKTENNYCIPSSWADRWREFADPNPTPRIKPPGPIDNSTLIDSDGNLLPEKADDFVPVNEHVWKYLINVHGGGPEVLAPRKKREAHRRRANSDEEDEEQA